MKNNRIDSMLAAAAEFEPECEPRHNFAVHAMDKLELRRRKWRTQRLVAMTAASVFVAGFVGIRLYSASINQPVRNPGHGGTNNNQMA